MSTIASMVPDSWVQRMAEQRERIEESRIIEDSRRIRSHARNVQEIQNIADKVIDPSFLNKCCGNTPNTGVRKGNPYIECPWCKSRTDGNNVSEVVSAWNNPTKDEE
jgi:hypothetical protein